MRDITNVGSLNLDRLAYNNQHDIGLQMDCNHLFCTIDDHVSLFRTGAYESALSKSTCAVKGFEELMISSVKNCSTRFRSACIHDLNAASLMYMKGNCGALGEKEMTRKSEN